MEGTMPFSVTANDVQDLMAASEHGESAISTLSGKHMIGLAELHAQTWPDWRTVVKSSEIRSLLAGATKHVERLYVTDHRLTRLGATLAAVLINDRITAVLDDGTAVQIIDHRAE